MLSYKDLMTRFGYFLDYWSRIELAISEVILEAENKSRSDWPKVSGTLDQRLQRWRAAMQRYPDQERLDEIVQQVQGLCKIRNLLVHGCAGGNSAPSDGGEPHIRCVVGGWQKPSGEVRRITLIELDHYIDVADACFRAVHHPHALNHTL